jgi:hypothetical protein
MTYRAGLIIIVVVSTLLAACGAPTIVEPPTYVPVEPTAMPEPTLTPKPVMVQPTAIPQQAAAKPRATPEPVAIQPTAPASDASACASSPEGEKGTVGVARGQSFCITWADTFDDERGFRVQLEYLRSGERFSYEVGPDTAAFAVPTADAPPADASGEQCMARKDFMVTVIALRPGGELPVNSMAGEGECRQTPPDEPEPSVMMVPMAPRVLV